MSYGIICLKCRQYAPCKCKWPLLSEDGKRAMKTKPEPELERLEAENERIREELKSK